MKTVLSIAGSDSSGGAGIQADIKTCEAFGVFGASVITVLTAQNTQGVSDIFEIDPEFVRAQIRAVLDDLKIDAIKIGMLYSKAIIDVVAEEIKDLAIPIVIDPVCVAKSGAKLLSDDAIESLKEIFPYATVVTPNQFEAALLFGYKTDEGTVLDDTVNKPYKILVKNDIVQTDEQMRSLDTLYDKTDKTIIDTPLLQSHNTHGAGCSYSSAIAANLALGLSLYEAIKIAKKFVYLAIKNGPQIGNGVMPLGHKTAGEICHIAKI